MIKDIAAWFIVVFFVVFVLFPIIGNQREYFKSMLYGAVIAFVLTAFVAIVLAGTWAVHHLTS